MLSLRSSRPKLAPRHRVQLHSTHVESIPISAVQFDERMKRFQISKDDRVAVAVSGGSDSMALLLLMQRWCQAKGIVGNLIAVSVDHKLRKESSDEMLQVGMWLQNRGIRHVVSTLSWDKPPPPAKLQQEARLKRVFALQSVCFKHNVNWLLMAHHLDDAIETFFMRLTRASALMGLPGLRSLTHLPVSPHILASYGANFRTFRAPPVLSIIRPLLEFKKSSLTATCREFAQPWIEDPSNFLVMFDRVRARNALLALSFPVSQDSNPLTADALQGILSTFENLRENLFFLSTALLRKCAIVNEQFGVGVVSLPLLMRASPDLRALAVARLTCLISNRSLLPSLSSFDRLEALQHLPRFRFLASGCIVEKRNTLPSQLMLNVPAEAPFLLIYTETPRPPTLQLCTIPCSIFEDRFTLHLRPSIHLSADQAKQVKASKLRIRRLTLRDRPFVLRFTTLPPALAFSFGLPALVDEQDQILLVPALSLSLCSTFTVRSLFTSWRAHAWQF